ELIACQQVAPTPRPHGALEEEGAWRLLPARLARFDADRTFAAREGSAGHVLAALGPHEPLHAAVGAQRFVRLRVHDVRRAQVPAIAGGAGILAEELGAARGHVVVRALAVGAHLRIDDLDLTLEGDVGELPLLEGGVGAPRARPTPAALAVGLLHHDAVQRLS